MVGNSNMQPGALGLFKKSGNRVRVIASDPQQPGDLLVERVDGASAGKRMIIPARAFQPGFADP